MESLPHVFYNDNDTSCFHWLSNLTSTGLLPPGLVSSRSIRDLRPRDIPPNSTAHFFAGIGGWPLALKLSHWPPSIPVWTGSCPCQPYSVAGKRKGDADSRSLWPEFHRLIRHHRPPVCFGEQVASADGRVWLAGVRSDLEKLGYEVGAADLCAAGVGAPHIRQRLYWVAYDKREGLEGREIKSAWEEFKAAERGGDAGGEWMAHGEEYGCGQEREDEERSGGGGEEEEGAAGFRMRGAVSGVGNTQHTIGRAERKKDSNPQGRNGFRRPNDPHSRGEDHPASQQTRIPRFAREQGESDLRLEIPNGVQRERERGTKEWRREPQDRANKPSLWDDYELIPCLDGYYRRIEPGTSPLASGVPSRMVKLRGYGNSIVVPLAAEFITAFLECL